MVVRVLSVLAVVAVLCGCGQANAPVEKKEKRAGVEQAAKPQEDRAAEVTRTPDATCDPDLPAYKQGTACAGGMEAAAEAMNEPLTVEGMNEMYDGIRARGGGEEADRFSGALLNCQLTKYAQEHGQEAASDHAADLVNEVIETEEGSDTVQARLIEEGYTCSMSEVNNLGQ